MVKDGAFQMGDETKENPGTFTLNSVSIHVLFDSGVMFSFVSSLIAT